MLLTFVMVSTCILQARGDSPGNNTISHLEPTNWVLPGQTFRVTTKGATEIMLSWNEQRLRIYSRLGIKGNETYVEGFKKDQDGIQIGTLEIEGDYVSLNLSVSGPGILRFGFLNLEREFHIQTKDTVHSYLTLYDYSSDRYIENNSIVVRYDKSLMATRLKAYSLMGATVTCEMCCDGNCSTLVDLQDPKLKDMPTYYANLEVIYEPRVFEFVCWTNLSDRVKQSVTITASAIILPQPKPPRIEGAQAEAISSRIDLIVYLILTVMLENVAVLLVYSSDCCARNCKKEKSTSCCCAGDCRRKRRIQREYEV